MAPKPATAAADVFWIIYPVDTGSKGIDTLSVKILLDSTVRSGLTMSMQGAH